LAIFKSNYGFFGGVSGILMNLEGYFWNLFYL